jgi:hypothetical protein
VAPVARWDVEDYEAVEQNLEGLTADVPDIAIGEIPRRYQCHTVGMSESLSRLLLARVARSSCMLRIPHTSEPFSFDVGFTVYA